MITDANFMRHLGEVVNRFLSIMRLRVIRYPVSSTSDNAPKAFVHNYLTQLKSLKNNRRSTFKIYESFRYNSGPHPKSYIDYECEFVSNIMSKEIKAGSAPKILDIGSYRTFVIGLLAYYEIHTLDVRTRHSCLSNEIILVGDAKRIGITDGYFDIVLSMCAIEHFGLGRYGDEFDISADKKAFQEIDRVLKPGGHFIFTTTITNAHPCICFNAHKIYNYDMLSNLLEGMQAKNEKYFSHDLDNYCHRNEVTQESGKHDIYMGHWQKNL